MVGRTMVFLVICAGLLLMSCNNSNPASGGGAPAITTQPASQTVNEGSSASFTVVATGDPAPTYQWQKNGSDIQGATSATYTIASTVPSNTGTYRVVVTNSAGSVTSISVTLTVTPTSPAAPTIATQPASLTVNEGSSAAFTVVAYGNPAPSYQWRKNGTAINGATNATYTISSATQADAGIYTVYISNTQGNVTSNDAVLAVTAAPEILTYTVSGDSITVTMADRIHSYTYCNGNTLVIGYDTSDGWVQTIWFSVSGNTLSLDQGSGIGTLSRVGSGTGLIGTWTPDDTLYDMPDTLIFDASTITAIGTGGNGNNCPADDYISYQWPGYSSGFNGTANEISCSQVTIHGNTSGETVTISWNGNDDMTYTSSDAGHATYTWYSNPTSCPDNWEPTWWWTFINAN